jgi:lysophospholipase L1-like esterase
MLKLLPFIGVLIMTFLVFFLKTNHFLAGVLFYIFFVLSLYLGFKILNVKNIKKSVKFYFFGVYIFLLSLEFFLRSFPFLKTYTEKNNLSYKSTFEVYHEGWYINYPKNHKFYSGRKEFNYKYFTNDLGILANNYKEKSTKKKILCLGDSFTEGVGSPQDSSWPSLLQYKLDEYMPQYYDVINGGISGSDVFFSSKLYKDKLSCYKPDEIIIFINWTDLDDIIIRGTEERFGPNHKLVMKKGPIYERLYMKSFIFRFIIHKVLQLNYLFITDSKFKEKQIEACNVISKKLNEIENLLNKDSIPMKVVIHPIREELKLNKYFVNCFEKMIEKGGYEKLDLLNYSIENNVFKKKKDEYFWPYDGHFNSDGYDIVAQSIFDYFYSKKDYHD